MDIGVFATVLDLSTFVPHMGGDQCLELVRARTRTHVCNGKLTCAVPLNRGRIPIPHNCFWWQCFAPKALPISPLPGAVFGRVTQSIKNSYALALLGVSPYPFR